MAFDPDTFVDACRGALTEPEPQLAVREVVARAVSSPSAITSALGESHRRAEGMLAN